MSFKQEQNLGRRVGARRCILSSKLFVCWGSVFGCSIQCYLDRLFYFNDLPYVL